ncbi:hypothetical protein C2845_PM07G20740 [Panicum miliaceum]|uniref:Late embryogenesis abundant protein LEA-2 subgroup domain-containing protein n=1 Tax=Panicum miliaceum TaxID=4540 RepID=A0A3L6SJB5_PANMI|nr:hypothetical protein C2845_PM07G20740 [Panicum miliaceum]
MNNSRRRQYSLRTLILITFWLSSPIWFGLLRALPPKFSVQLVGARGLDAPGAREYLHPASRRQGPGALAGTGSGSSGALLVRVENGHYYDVYREGGHVTVSYAGVPLARGRTPSFRLGAEATLAFTVNAESSVGVPEDLFRLMSAERRHGAAQLEVVMQLGWPGWESYAWSVDLDG